MVLLATTGAVAALALSAADRVWRRQQALAVYGALDPAALQRRLWGAGSSPLPTKRGSKQPHPSALSSGLHHFAPLSAASLLQTAAGDVHRLTVDAVLGRRGRALSRKLPRSATKGAGADEYSSLLALGSFDGRSESAVQDALQAPSPVHGGLARALADTVVFSVWLASHFDPMIWRHPHQASKGSSPDSGPARAAADSLLASCAGDADAGRRSVASACARVGLSAVAWDPFEAVFGLSPWRADRRWPGSPAAQAMAEELAQAVAAMTSRALDYEVRCWNPTVGTARSSGGAPRVAGTLSDTEAQSFGPPLAVLATAVTALCSLLAAELCVPPDQLAESVRRRFNGLAVAQRKQDQQSPPLMPASVFAAPGSTAELLARLLGPLPSRSVPGSGPPLSALDAGFHPSSPSCPVRARFVDAVVSRTLCPFASAARAWTVPFVSARSPACLAVPSLSLLPPPVRSAAVAAPWLARFSQASFHEQLQAFCVEIDCADVRKPEEGGSIMVRSSTTAVRATGANVPGVCACLRRFLAALTVLDRQGAGDATEARLRLLSSAAGDGEIPCWWLESGAPAQPSWSFSFAGQRYFCTVFAKCYGDHSTRQSQAKSDKRDIVWILLQPEHSFPRAGVSGKDDKGTVRSKIRRAFSQGRRPYPPPEVGEPAAMSYVMPAPDTFEENLDKFTPVLWWLTEPPSVSAVPGGAKGKGGKEKHKKKGQQPKLEPQNPAQKKKDDAVEARTMPTEEKNGKNKPTPSPNHQQEKRKDDGKDRVQGHQAGNGQKGQARQREAVEESQKIDQTLESFAADVLALLGDGDEEGSSSPGRGGEPEGLTVSRQLVDRFVSLTGFQPIPFRSLLTWIREVAGDSSLDVAQFRVVARNLFFGHKAAVPGNDADGWTVQGKKSVAKGKKSPPEVFVESLSSNQLDKLLNWMFDLLDLDDSGALDAKESLLALNMFGCAPFRERALVCFDAFDADGNGVLDEHELRDLILTTLVKSRSLITQLFDGFESIIVDEDRLTEKERKAKRRRMLRADEDRKTKGEEQVVMFRGSSGGVAQIFEVAAKAFREADTDRSGSIDKEGKRGYIVV